MSTGPRRRPLVAAVTAATALLLGACSGGSSTTVTAGGGSSTTAAESQAAAQRVVLGATDLPGYDATPAPTVDAPGAKAASTFQYCARAATSGALGTAGRAAASPGFYKGRTTMVSSLAVVSPDTAAAQRAMDELSSDEVATCLTTLFKDVLLLDQLPGVTTRTERLPTAKVSDESITWRTTIHVASGQASIPVYSDLTIFRNGRTVAALFNVQIGTPFASAERSRLLQSMVERTT